MYNPNSLGKSLRLKRKALGLTLIELESQMGLSSSTISMVETGTFRSPSFSTLTLFGAFYNMTLIELMKMIDFPDQKTKEYIKSHE